MGQRKSKGVRRTSIENRRIKCAHQVLDVSRRAGPSTLLDARKEQRQDKGEERREGCESKDGKMM